MLPQIDRDRILVHQFRHGSQRAARQLFEIHAGYLMAVCRRYLPADSSCEDIVQEAFIKAFAAIESFEWKGRGSFRAWLARIAANCALKELRRRSRMQPVEICGDLPDVADDDDGTAAAVSAAPASAIIEMIQRLPDGYRAVFNLYVFEQMSHAEIGAALGISEGTSASQLHRAKKLLARMIRDYEKELD